MADLCIRHGYDLPLLGQPEGEAKALDQLIPGFLFEANEFSLDLSRFENIRIRPLVALGDHVRLGQPIAQDRDCPERVFVSPASGSIKELTRGIKRRLLSILIERSEEQPFLHPITSSQYMGREDIIQRLLQGGIFTSIKQRPFDLLAQPQQMPRSIFVNGVRSLPFLPPPEWDVSPHLPAFQEGLSILKKLTEGPVFVIYREASPIQNWIQGKNVEGRSVKGPHPVGNPSVHIEAFDPIQTISDVVWTLDIRTVVAIGVLFQHGKYHTDRIVSIAGPGIIPEKRGYFRVREGFSITPLVSGRLVDEPTRIISGDPLTGKAVGIQDFLGFNDSAVTVLLENEKRKLLHFLRLGKNQYTLSHAYLTGFISPPPGGEPLNTNPHGEQRPIIDGSLYDRYLPLEIPTAALIRALMAREDELAVELGLLSVAPEDFVLPAFACPSKIDLPGIVQDGLVRVYSENFS